ncbi:MAG: NUDIX domain-containing protein [Clostridia bacterium]|nr:NUDIX domain-containing protein [Clostridia bacterium]
MERNWHRHIGSYGICAENGEILVIKKVTGPYAGRYDLPGGGIKDNETILEGIKREILEETGYEISKIVNKGTYDFLAEAPYNGHTHTHHIANFFIIEEALKNKIRVNISEMIDENEVNDSAGIKWISIDNLNDKNSSPLLVVAKKIINKEKISSDIVMFS